MLCHATHTASLFQDFYLFGPMKEPLRGVQFNGEKEIKRALKASLVRFPQEWLEEGRKLEKRRKSVLKLKVTIYVLKK